MVGSVNNVYYIRSANSAVVPPVASSSPASESDRDSAGAAQRRAVEPSGNNILTFPSARLAGPVSVEDSIDAHPDLAADVKAALRALAETVAEKPQVKAVLVEMDAASRVYAGLETGFESAAADIRHDGKQREVARTLYALSDVYGRLGEGQTKASILLLSGGTPEMLQDHADELSALRAAEARLNADLAAALSRDPALQDGLQASLRQSFGALYRSTVSELESRQQLYAAKVAELPGLFGNGPEVSDAVTSHLKGLLAVEHVIAADIAVIEHPLMVKFGPFSTRPAT